jgi:putative MFS transporter
MKEKRSYKDAPMSPIHKKVFLSLSLGQIACAYALGIAGTGLSQANTVLNISSFWTGLIGAATLIGLFGSTLIGFISDKFGRKNLFTYSMVLFVLLSISQLATTSLPLLFIIRVCLGMVISIDYTVGSAILTEWLPEKEGPKYQGYQLICWYIGFILSYFVGLYVTRFGNEMWQWTLSSSAVLGVVVGAVRILNKIPESPSWLQSNGRSQEALKLVHSNLGNEYDLPELEVTTKSKPVAWSELFGKGVRRSTLVGGIFWTCQVFPFYGLGIFLPILLENLKMDNPMMGGIFYNLFMLVGVVLGVFTFKKFTRRGFLMLTFYVAALALIIMIAFPNAPQVVTLIVFSSFSVVLAGSSILQYVYPPELFETRLRGSGVGTVVAMSRTGAALGTIMTPVITERFGAYGTLAFSCMFLIVGGLVSQFFAPETSLISSNGKKSMQVGSALES